MKNNKLSDKLKAGIESYSGRKVENIKVHPDPRVDGTYAMRTKLTGLDGTCDWLIIHFDDKWGVEQISENLEECDFGAWPPISGSLKFF